MQTRCSRNGRLHLLHCQTYLHDAAIRRRGTVLLPDSELAVAMHWRLEVWVLFILRVELSPRLNESFAAVMGGKFAVTTFTRLHISIVECEAPDPRKYLEIAQFLMTSEIVCRTDSLY